VSKTGKRSTSSNAKSPKVGAFARKQKGAGSAGEAAAKRRRKHDSDGSEELSERLTPDMHSSEGEDEFDLDAHLRVPGARHASSVANSDGEELVPAGVQMARKRKQEKQAKEQQTRDRSFVTAFEGMWHVYNAERIKGIITKGTLFGDAVVRHRSCEFIPTGDKPCAFSVEGDGSDAKPYILVSKFGNAEVHKAGQGTIIWELQHGGQTVWERQEKAAFGRAARSPALPERHASPSPPSSPPTPPSPVPLREVSPSSQLHAPADSVVSSTGLDGSSAGEAPLSGGAMSETPLSGGAVSSTGPSICLSAVGGLASGAASPSQAL